MPNESGLLQILHLLCLAHRVLTSSVSGCSDSSDDCKNQMALQATCHNPALAERFCKRSCGLCQDIWTDWSSWTPCPVTCGGGHQNRSRQCMDPSNSQPATNCTGNSQESRLCSGKDCPDIWTEWSHWMLCSVTCGGGHQNRSRQCIDPANTQPATNCTGNSHETRSCSKHNCPDLPLDMWGTWTHWTRCSALCGGGQRRRNRECKTTMHQVGSSCLGAATEIEPCATHCCPVNGHWGHWSKWSTCATICDVGHRHRDRSCDNPAPTCGGSDCQGLAKEVENCPCHDYWGSWSHWTHCSMPCGGGRRRRFRTCENPTKPHGGRHCQGEVTQIKVCGLQCCPVSGQWGSWSEWSTCTKSCGGGHRHRKRFCDNPAPKCSGNSCSGYDHETELCSTMSCPDAECVKAGGGTCRDIEHRCHGYYRNGICSSDRYCCIRRPKVEFIGCFSYIHSLGTSIGYHFQHHIDTRLRAPGKMTIEYCIGYCRMFGMLFAAPEFHSHCQCANGIPRLFKKVKNGECRAICDGDSNTFCGGSYKVSLYKIT